MIECKESPEENIFELDSSDEESSIYIPWIRNVASNPCQPTPTFDVLLALFSSTADVTISTLSASPTPPMNIAQHRSSQNFNIFDTYFICGATPSKRQPRRFPHLLTRVTVTVVTPKRHANVCTLASSKALASARLASIYLARAQFDQEVIAPRLVSPTGCPLSPGRFTKPPPKKPSSTRRTPSPNACSCKNSILIQKLKAQREASITDLASSSKDVSDSESLPPVFILSQPRSVMHSIRLAPLLPQAPPEPLPPREPLPPLEPSSEASSLLLLAHVSAQRAADTAALDARASELAELKSYLKYLHAQLLAEADNACRSANSSDDSLSRGSSSVRSGHDKAAAGETRVVVDSSRSGDVARGSASGLASVSASELFFEARSSIEVDPNVPEVPSSGRNRTRRL